MIPSSQSPGRCREHSNETQPGRCHSLCFQLAKLDRNRLRASIADILYHEILARHDYTFSYLHSRDGLIAAGADVDELRQYFEKYGYRDGWYYPDDEKNTDVVRSEINEVEFANLDFLAIHRVYRTRPPLVDLGDALVQPLQSGFRGNAAFVLIAIAAATGFFRLARNRWTL